MGASRLVSGRRHSDQQRQHRFRQPNHQPAEGGSLAGRDPCRRQGRRAHEHSTGTRHGREGTRALDRQADIAEIVHRPCFELLGFARRGADRPNTSHETIIRPLRRQSQVLFAVKDKEAGDLTRKECRAGAIAPMRGTLRDRQGKVKYRLTPTIHQEAYSRADVRRRFGLSERVLRSWERQSLLPAAEWYSFSDLIAIRTILELRSKGFRSRQIVEAVESLRRKLEGVRHPLSELRILSNGKKIAVRLGGQQMEAISGQILIDFDAAELGRLRNFPETKRAANRVREAELWFQKGLELEETGAPLDRIIEAYRKVIELNPEAAGALVNLGTVYYRERRFAEAEQYYKDAATADPGYPLAEFNLGNLYDEEGRLREALDHYQRALALNPQYADAHFNLALLCERTGEALKAVHHWKCYLKLDRSGSWAEIAQRQLERLRKMVIPSP